MKANWKKMHSAWKFINGYWLKHKKWSENMKPSQSLYSVYIHWLGWGFFIFLIWNTCETTKSINNHAITAFYRPHPHQNHFISSANKLHASSLTFLFSACGWVSTEHIRHVLGRNPKPRAGRYLDKVAGQPLEEQHIGGVEEQNVLHFSRTTHKGRCNRLFEQERHCALHVLRLMGSNRF